MHLLVFINYWIGYLKFFSESMQTESWDGDLFAQRVEIFLTSVSSAFRQIPYIWIIRNYYENGNKTFGWTLPSSKEKYCSASLDTFLGAFEKWQTATFNHTKSVCPSVYPHATSRLPQDGYSWNLFSCLFFLYTEGCKSRYTVLQDRQP